ncbi:MAG: CocE/NonD family hydrolase [Alphaproteobacteria bacterium]
MTEFPTPFRVIENLWVTLPDGERMAARAWMPEGSETKPVPAIIKYIPYRKRDRTRGGDEALMPYFAGHGYACLRVDMRGSGDSDGLMEDEYLEQELQDGKDAIAWIAEQPWCDGNVGIIGISWSGFNGLQIAARRPPALKAVITACSTDDRYADDMHYMGGCLLNDCLDWGASFFNTLHTPPDPEIRDDWRQQWIRRLDNGTFPMAAWLKHQRRDAFWKHGSVNEDWSAIQCPVFAMGGWMDGYSNAIPRLLENLTVPRMGLIGPWAHLYGHQGRPGPAMDFLAMCVRWWDQWLKGVDTGVTREPMLRAYMQERVPARGLYDVCPGRWVAEDSWPSARITRQDWVLNGDGRLTPRPPGATREAAADPQAGADQTRLDLQSPQTVGIAGGEWCAYGTGGYGPQFPADQRQDDARSLVFESEPLQERVEILGQPRVRLRLAVDRPAAFVAVRLNDVHTDGSVSRASFGVLNLTHRNGSESPQAIEPGETMTVDVKLNDIAYAFEAGHRIRFAISTTYWPMIWPSPEPVTLSLWAGASHLSLPLRPARPADSELDLGEPVVLAGMAGEALEAPSGERVLHHDFGDDTVVIEASENAGRFRIGDTGTELSGEQSERFEIREGDPLSCASEITKTMAFHRDGWTIHVEATAALTATVDSWLLKGHIRVTEGDKVVFEKIYDCPTPRDHC